MQIDLGIHVLQLRLEVLLDGLPLELAGGVEEAVVVGKQVRVKVDVFDLQVANVVIKDWQRVHEASFIQRHKQ